MKGTIVKCLEELVCIQFGQDKWHQSLEKVGMNKDTVFFTLSDVDDEQVMKVVESVCSTLGINLPEAADAFGDYWVNTYSQKIYHQYYDRNKTARDFLLDMDNVHVTMTQTMENAHPPRFKFEWQDQDTLIVHYHSERGLIDFAVGLTKGVGKHYGEKLQVTKLGSDKFQVLFSS